MNYPVKIDILINKYSNDVYYIETGLLKNQECLLFINDYLNFIQKNIRNGLNLHSFDDTKNMYYSLNEYLENRWDGYKKSILRNKIIKYINAFNKEKNSNDFNKSKYENELVNIISCFEFIIERNKD